MRPSRRSLLEASSWCGHQNPPCVCFSSFIRWTIVFTLRSRIGQMAIGRDLKTMSKHIFLLLVHFHHSGRVLAKTLASLFDALRLSMFRKKYLSAWEDKQVRLVLIWQCRAKELCDLVSDLYLSLGTFHLRQWHKNLEMGSTSHLSVMMIVARGVCVCGVLVLLCDLKFLLSNGS